MYDGQEFSHNGHRFKVTFPYDDDAGMPWKNQDLIGSVSDWTRSAKQPGEMVLCSDRGKSRKYDFQAAMQAYRRVLRDYPDDSGLTVGQRAYAAVIAEFEYLRRWCNDQWHYVGCAVELLDDDGDSMGETESLWGIESDSGNYLEEVAHELAAEIIARLAGQLAA